VTCPAIFSSRDYDSVLNGFGGGAAFIEQTFPTQPVGDYTFSFWALNIEVQNNPGTNLYGALRPGDGGDIAPCSVPYDGAWHQCVFTVLNTAVSRAAIGYQIQGSGGTAALPAWRPFGQQAGKFRGLITAMNVYPGTSAGTACIQSEINYCDSFFAPSTLDSALPLPGFADPQFGWTTYFAGSGVLPVLTTTAHGPGNSGGGTCYGTQGGANIARCPPIFTSTRMQLGAQVGSGLEIIYRGWDQTNGGTGNFFQFDGGPQQVRMSFWARGTPNVAPSGYGIFFGNLTEGNGNPCELDIQADGGPTEYWRECSYAYTMTAATPGRYFYVGYHSGGGGNTPGIVPAGDWEITGFNVRYGLGTSGGLGGADLQGPYCVQP